MKLLSAIISLSLFSSSVCANDFYTDRERGWFWHEVQEDIIDEPKDEVAQSGASNQSDSNDSETITLDVAWLRENLPKLQEAAINNPTNENLAASAYANRLMNDFGSRFSTKMMDFMKLETVLSEESRRPTRGMNLSVFSQENSRAIKGIMDKLAKSHHMWFFFTSTCPYCAKQIPILKEFSYRTNFPILAISMDGGMLPGVENFDVVIDHGLNVSTRLGVKATPTMVLAGNEEGEENFIAVAEGLHTLTDLEDRLLILTRETGVISAEEYEKTRAVREINLFENKNGSIELDKAKLESDPGYLADALRYKLMKMNTTQSSAIQTEKPASK